MKNQATIPQTDRTIHAERADDGTYQVCEGANVLPYIIRKVPDRGWGVFVGASPVGCAVRSTIRRALGYVAKRVTYDEQWARYQERLKQPNPLPIPPMRPSLRVESIIPYQEIKLIAEPSESGTPAYAVEFAGRVVGHVGLYSGGHWSTVGAHHWYRHVWVNARYSDAKTPQEAAQRLVRATVDAVLAHQLGRELMERDNDAEKVRAQYA